jgi:hypothetical protein
MNKDTMKDWSLQLKEHQRALLELLIAKFPEVLTTKAKEVAVWRKRLTVGKH